MLKCVQGCVFFLSIIGIIRAEYHIRDKDVPSYLYNVFYSTDHIFPEDIRINVSLSRIDGTLLYSIDSRLNQLIVSLHDSVEPTIGIEIGHQNQYRSIIKLCRCKFCRYEPLDIRIQKIRMKNILKLQCNGGTVDNIVYGSTMKLNRNYPIPFNKADSSKNITTHMWLVNTPQYDEVYPDNKQLSGCILKVAYDDLPINFTTISTNVDKICIRRCTINICNGGRCYETYNKRPVCNCTDKFLNGRYCNDTVRSMNFKATNLQFQFEMFKLSWKSSVNEIFLLNNSNIRIQLRITDSVLTFEYTEDDKCFKITLLQKYVPNQEYIVIVRCLEKHIDIVFSKKHHSNIITNRDIRKEIFSTLQSRSGQGIIGMYYKTAKDYIWTKVSITDYIELEDEKNDQSKPSINKGGVNEFLYGLCFTLLLIVLVLLSFCSGYIKKRIEYKNEHKEKEVNIRLH